MTEANITIHPGFRLKNRSELQRIVQSDDDGILLLLSLWYIPFPAHKEPIKIWLGR